MNGTDLKEIREMLEEQNKDLVAFKERYAGALTELAAKVGRQMLGGPTQQRDIPESERKALDGAIRAIMSGDKSRADQLFREAKGMSAGTGPEGGFVVHPLISDGITKVMAEISPVYRLARVIQLKPGTDGFEEPIDRDTAGASWTGETSDRTETETPDFGLFSLTLGEIYAMPKVTQKLVDVASFDVLRWLQTKVGEAFGTKEGAAFHSGDGVGKPLGFLSHATSSANDATRPWNTVQYVPSGGASGFASSNPADALIDVVNALKPQYRSGATWLMNRTTASTVSKFKDGNGLYIWQNSLQAGQPAMLLGFPVEIDEDMPDLGTNAYPIAFGNVKRAYTIIEMPGIKFLPDPYSAKPHVLLYSYRRVAGGLNNSEALKLLKCATS